MAIPSLFLVIASSALFIAIPSKRMPHSSLFLSMLHTPAPLSSFLSSTHTNRLPHSFLFLLLLQLNTLLLLPTPFSADFVHVHCTHRTPNSSLILLSLYTL